MKTLVASSGAITDVSTKLLPGRYALAFKAATTSGFALTQGTLTIQQRLNQTAKFQTTAAVAASVVFEDLSPPGTEFFTIAAAEAGIAGNQITVGISDIFIADGTPFAVTTASQGGDHLAITIIVDAFNRIVAEADTWETDGAVTVTPNPATLTPIANINGRRAWRDTSGADDITFSVLEISAGVYAWALSLEDPADFLATVGDSAGDPDELPEEPPVTESITVVNGTFTGGASIQVRTPVTSTFDTSLLPDRVSLSFGPDDDKPFPVLGTTVLPLTGGAEAVITEETVDIPLLTDVLPGADALSYNLATAAQRRAHLEFVVSEAGSLLITLTGGNSTGALHLSCNPINA